MGSGASKKKDSAPAAAAAKSTKAAATAAAKSKGKEKPPEPVPKPVAFEIKFEDKYEDSIIRKHPPKRLQRLEPLPEGGPKLTAAMLEKKLQIAEENRQRELDKVRRVTSASRIRRQIQDARVQDKEQEFVRGVEERSRSAGKAVSTKLKHVEDNTREKVTKAKGILDKNNRRKQFEDEFGEIERGRHFTDDDDWDWSEKTGTSRQRETAQRTSETDYILSHSTRNNLKHGPYVEDDDEFFG